MTPLPPTSGRLRVLVVGPELLANALHALLATIEDLAVLTPISEPDEVLPFIQRIGHTPHPIDVVVLHCSGDLEADHMLLEALSKPSHMMLDLPNF